MRMFRNDRHPFIGAAVEPVHRFYRDLEFNTSHSFIARVVQGFVGRIGHSNTDSDTAATVMGGISEMSTCERY